MKLQSRPALITVCVLVCLMVASSLAISSLRSTILHRREIQSREQRLQAEWLLDAGIRLTILRVHATNEYVGEVWRPEGLPTTCSPAVVVIQSMDDDTSWRIAACVGASELNDLPRFGVVRVEYILKLPKSSLQTTESNQ